MNDVARRGSLCGFQRVLPPFERRSVNAAPALPMLQVQRAPDTHPGGPAGQLLGRENQGFYAIMDNFQNERMVLGGMAIGEADKAIEITLDYLRQRQAFGAPLWDKQVIRQRLAMRAAQVESVRQLAYHTAWLDAGGADCTKEVSMLKALSAEVANQTMYDCLQFHGGMGYMREATIERMVRDARVLPIGGGATEVMLEEVAKRL